MDTITAAQRKYIESLRSSRVVDAETAARLDARIDAMSKRLASETIDWLKRQPVAAPVAPVPPARPASVTLRSLANGPVESTTSPRPTTPGVFKVDGVVYQVKPNKTRTRLYAKRLVEINGERLAEDGAHVKIEFEYEAGAIYKITEAHRMSVEEGKALTLRYGRCLCCGRKLKNATSVERGIGPVCIKYFA